MKLAEMTMYEAKRRGKDVIVYHPDFHRHDLKRRHILAELRRAIGHNDLIVHYQPQFDPRSDRIIGVEALVRWRHSRLGLLLPGEFIAVAEQSGLIHRLNRWVLGSVFEQLAAWQAQDIELPISANVSVINLQDRSFFQHIVDGVQGRGLRTDRLKLEITETAVMSDPGIALPTVKRLSQFGVRFSIDDFGTGYSSLLYLREMPADEIKIDRSFIVNMTRDNNNAIIVRSTIDLAHSLGRLVTAEGIESRETLELLAHWHCDTLQGFYLSPPLSIDNLTLQLHAQGISPGSPTHVH